MESPFSLRRLTVVLANTVALPLYVLWFGLHESADLVGEVGYEWRTLFRGIK
jgi:hypothetical protein